MKQSLFTVPSFIVMFLTEKDGINFLSERISKELWMAEKQAEIQVNFESLLKLGYAIIDVRFKKYENIDKTYKYIMISLEHDRDDFYQNMLKNYLGKTIPEKNIYELWINILNHKLKMSSKLGRDISIKVAAFDYLETKEI